MPHAFKQATVRPLLKKSWLNPEQPGNFRPVLNLSNISKLVEKVVASRLNAHIDAHNLSCPFQSAYRKGYSVETALLKVKEDILCAFDNQNGVLPALLDLSAAFDTVDHNILLSHLKNLRVTDVALHWIRPYLSGHSQCVCINGVKSSKFPLCCGVPLGSVLGPILFSIYTLSLSTVLDKHNLCHHIYADATQIYLPFRPKCSGSYDESKSRLESCISDVRIWMANNLLKLNDSKSELLILRPSRPSAHLSKVPAPLAIGRCQVSPAVSARNIGLIFDETMSMDKQIRQVCKSAFHQLHNIRSIRIFLDRDALQTLVTSKLDSFNSLYSGLPVCQIMKLQRVQNAAARLVLGIPRCEHITPGLKSLHWLPVEKRIVFNSASLLTRPGIVWLHRICMVCFFHMHWPDN